VLVDRLPRGNQRSGGVIPVEVGFMSVYKSVRLIFLPGVLNFPILGTF
jgi:hypothetical protein